MNYFYLTDDAEITIHPEDPVIVPNRDHNGIVTFEIKAYPLPTFEFCYNATCNVDHALSRVHVRVDPLNDDETMHTAQFIIHNMNEMDNGYVTLRVIQPERDINFNHTVMLFLPCKFVPIQCGDLGTLWGFLVGF